MDYILTGKYRIPEGPTKGVKRGYLSQIVLNLHLLKK